MSRKISCKVGEWTDSSGAVKSNYVTIGTIAIKDGREYVVLDPSVSLAGCYARQTEMNKAALKPAKSMLFASIYEDDGARQKSHTPTQPPAPGAPVHYVALNEDIPF